MINSIRLFEKARGTGKKEPTPSEQKNLLSNRVSIIVMKDLAEGSIITSDVIDVRRPGSGLAPKFFDTMNPFHCGFAPYHRLREIINSLLLQID